MAPRADQSLAWHGGALRASNAVLNQTQKKLLAEITASGLFEDQSAILTTVVHSSMDVKDVYEAEWPD